MESRGPTDLLGAGKAAEKAIDAAQSFLATLLGPFVKEVGEFFADPIREHRRRRAAEVLLRTRANLQGQTPRTVPPRLLIPILERASLEEDDMLRGKWVALLTSAATSEIKSPHPAFPDILAQLSSVDAQFLDQLRLIYGNSNSVDSKLGHEEILNATFSQLFANPPAGARLGDSFLTTTDNLKRLGIIEVLWRDERKQNLWGRGAPVYYLTQLGIDFLLACTPARKPPT